MVARDIGKRLQRNLGDFFHGSNLIALVQQHKALTDKGLSDDEAFDVICEVFNTAKSEFGE